jgi:peptidoglycan/xylan/chitin deacetylase (PgdA/CDA1 family)
MRYFRRKKIAILMYHVFTGKRACGGIEDNEGLRLNFEKFRLQIQYLKKYYNIISLDKMVEHYTKGVKLPLNPVVITIDDGYKSSYTLAYPIIKEFGVPATIFLTTDFIDKKQMLWHDRIEYAIDMTKSSSFKLKIDKEMLFLDFQSINSKKMYCREIIARLKSMPQESMGEIIENLECGLGQKLSLDGDVPEIYQPLEWHEVLEMIESGMISIGSHTCAHVILTRCSPERARKELFLSKQVIQNKTGLSCRLFCYPNGGVGDFDYRTRKLLKELGYSCGLTAVEGMNDASSDVFELRRLSVDSREDLITFIMTLSGIFKVFSDTKESILNIAMAARRLSGISYSA